MIETGLELILSRDLRPGDRVRMRDREENVSHGLLLMVRSNPVNASDPIKDALVLLDDPNTKDTWGWRIQLPNIGQLSCQSLKHWQEGRLLTRTGWQRQTF